MTEARILAHETGRHDENLTFGSLFAGIGGFDLGFERAGLKCEWQVEIDPYCQRVLAKYWPNVRRWDDVRTFPPAGEWGVDVICGWFPCQDISSANHNGKGIKGNRSGLWSQYVRTVRVLRPKFVVIENVVALTFRGLDRVLFDLAKSGYDAEWQTISAQMLGAPHERDRVFIVAYTTGQRCQADEVFACRPFETASQKQKARIREWAGQCEHSPALSDRIRWCPNRELCRVADGLPDELDRYRVVGNSVIPQAAEWIGRRLMGVVHA